MTETSHRQTLTFELDRNMDKFDRTNMYDFQSYSPVNVCGCGNI